MRTYAFVGSQINNDLTIELGVSCNRVRERSTDFGEARLHEKVR